MGIESGPAYEKACMTTCIINFLEFSGYLPSDLTFD